MHGPFWGHTACWQELGPIRGQIVGCVHKGTMLTAAQLPHPESGPPVRGGLPHEAASRLSGLCRILHSGRPPPRDIYVNAP